MKIILTLFIIAISISGKAQTIIDLKTLQGFLFAKSIDEVERDLRSLGFSFRETGSTDDGSNTVYYQKANFKSRTYDFIVFRKNKLNTGFSTVRFITYEEPQFYNLKNECSKLQIVETLPEEVKDNCLKRMYNTKIAQFQFSTCKDSDGRTVYAVDLFPIQ
jgi:hypothetical protein